MGSFSFVIRTTIITVLLVLAMQIRWGTQTIEDHVMMAITSSEVVTPLNKTAQGTVVFLRNMWTKANRSFDTHFSKAMQEENRPGSRHLAFSVERSEKAVKQKAEQVEEAAKGAYEEVKASSTFQKIKEKASATSAKIRSKFIDESAESTSDRRAVKSENIRE